MVKGGGLAKLLQIPNSEQKDVQQNRKYDSIMANVRAGKGDGGSGAEGRMNRSAGREVNCHITMDVKQMNLKNRCIPINR